MGGGGKGGNARKVVKKGKRNIPLLSVLEL
jgi:hypothetical protein